MGRRDAGVVYGAPEQVAHRRPERRRREGVQERVDGRVHRHHEHHQPRVQIRWWRNKIDVPKNTLDMFLFCNPIKPIDVSRFPRDCNKLSWLTSPVG